MQISPAKQQKYTTCIFAAAICLSVFFATLIDAQASVVWSGVQDIRMGPGDSHEWLPSYSTWVLDLNTDGVGDFRFDFTEISDFVVSTLASNAVTTQDHHPMLEIWDSWPLTEGVRIDPTLDAVTRWGSNDYVLIDWEASGGSLGQVSSK